MLNIFDIIGKKYFIEIDSKVYGENLKNLKKLIMIVKVGSSVQEYAVINNTELIFKTTDLKEAIIKYNSI